MDYGKELEDAKSILEYLGRPREQLPDTLLDDDSEEPTPRDEDKLLIDHYREDSLSSIKTVRFFKDFGRYNAGFDITTKNKSFLKVAEQFRLMGVRNYYFCLQLNNPLLAGVDPYDPNLTEDQKFMILNECRQNFWYFIREVLRLSGNIQFQAHRANICFLWSYLCHVNTILIIPRQFGKDQPLNANIKIPNGWKKMGDIAEGDIVTTPDGLKAKVSGTYLQGERDCYKTTFEDGRSTITGPEHLWKVTDGVNWDVYNTVSCKARLKDRNKFGCSLSVPLVEPDADSDLKYRLPPYLAGVLSQQEDEETIVFSSMHSEVKERLNKILPANLKLVKEKGVMKIIPEKSGVKRVKTTKGLIPSEYLNGSYHQRLEVLQGVLDMRGKVTAPHTATISTESKKLAEAIVYLARSLGGKAFQKVSKGVYQLELTHQNVDQWFSVGSKKEKAIELSRGVEYDNTLKIVSIEYESTEETKCIEVEHPDHLYITDDFVVTHNTVSAQSILFWLTYLTGKAYESHLITLKDDNRSQFVEAIKGIRNSCPKWLTNVTYRDKDAGNSLMYGAFGEDKKNILRISVPQIGKEAARNVGRGMTVKTRLIDEPSYINFIETILNGAGPSTIKARDNARASGEPYGTAFITTPASVHTDSGKYMHDMLMDSTEWRETYFDCFNESDLYAMLVRNSPLPDVKSPTVGMVFNYLQLGKNKDWIKKTIDELKMSLAEAKIDLLLMWDDTGKGKLFDDLTREALNEGKRGILWSQEMGDTGLFIDWFIPREKHVEILRGNSDTYYGIGCDTSAAVNKDACTVVIRDLSNGEVVGVGRYPIAYLMDVGGVLETLLLEITNSILIIERNFAHQMIDQLLRTLPALGIDPFKRIFNQVYQDPVKYENEYREIKQRSFANRDSYFYLKFKHLFGFVTNNKTREELYGFLQECVGTTGHKIYYTKLIDELINLKEKNNRIDHDSKGHDDLVIAWLLVFWFMKLGESKSEYGVPPGINMSRMQIMKMGDDDKKQMNDPQKEEMIKLYRRKIEELNERLVKTNDNMVANRIEVMIERLSSMIPPESRKLLTVDDLVRKAKDERNKRLAEIRKKRSRYSFF